MIDPIDLFFEPGDVVELRALGKMKNVVQSGYFKDFKKLAGIIKILDSTGEHKGIYLVLNKINPALYARSPDTLSAPRASIATTSDSDILARRWLPVDFDPTRPTDISSSDEEHEAALQRAREVREALRAMGWPEPIFADSGNGAHLVYRIDMPNNDKATETIELVLKAMDALFSDNKIKIDTKNYNASRIWKAYGTFARKGANVPDRPWRRSQVLEAPAEIKPVPEELLASMAWEFQQKDEAERTPRTDGKIDLEQWLSSHGLDVVKRKTAHGGGIMFILERCPWDSSHTDRSAWAVQFPSGAIAAGCHHNSCSGKGWGDLRRLYEPKHEPKIEQPQPKSPIKKALDQLRLEDLADVEYDEKKGGIKSVKFNPSKAADAICQYMDVLATPDKKIWVYEAGYYRPDGDVLIDQVIDSLAGSAYSINASKETLKKIWLRALVPFEELDKNPYLLCCKNGVVDLLTGAFSEHSPEYKITMPCPITYDPKAVPTQFIKFLDESCSNDDDRLTLIDWLVACACLTEFEYILFLTGHGGNGKHVYEQVCQALFGSETTEAIGLEELTNSKFAIGYLRRARLCISSETNPSKITTELAKKISGGDWLSSDVKNRDRIRFKPFTQLLWDSNGMPVFEDNSEGFKRRFTRTNMPYRFVDNPDPSDPLQKKKDPHLVEKLTSPEELSGILNLIIHRARVVAKDRKIHRRENDFEEYERQSMSATDFIENFIEFDEYRREDKEWHISSDYLYSKFEEYKKYMIGAGMTRKSFSRLVGKYNGEPSTKIRIMGLLVRGFRGLIFEEDRFKAFIEEKKKELTNYTSIVPISSVQERIIGTISTDNSKDNCTDVPNVPNGYRDIKDKFCNIYEISMRSECGLIGTEIGTNAIFRHPAASLENENAKNVPFRVRYDEDSDWELCEKCGIPVPPSQASEYRGDTYCPKCIMIALKEMEE